MITDLLTEIYKSAEIRSRIKYLDFDIHLYK